MPSLPLIQPFVDDARDAYALYTGLRRAELVALRTAHEHDLADSTTPESVAFGGGRLALIAFVLRTGAHRA